LLFFVFFQAEDGIRVRDVTGVQTCALPISKYYTKQDKINYILERQINTLSAIVSKERSMYDNNMNKISDLPIGQYRSEMFNYYFNQYRSIVDSSKRDAQDKISKAILKLV